MTDLANFLDLEFTESLLVPTSLDEKWKGNSTAELEFHTVSSSRLESWKSEINHLEIELINKVLSEILDKYGYAIQETHKNLYIPVMNEKPIQYCLNRMLARKGLI